MPGTTFGVADTGALAEPSPTELEATMVNEYTVPFVRPTTVQEVMELVQVLPPGFAVTTYLVIVAPPLWGAVQVNLTDAF